MTVTLYQIAPSFYSQIARLALVEKGVDWHERMVNLGPAMENYEPWFMRINPKGVVPVLDHDGTIVTEALAIIRYVDATFDGPPLTPTGSQARAEMDARLERLAAFPVRELSYGLLLGKPVGGLVAHTFDLRRSTLKRHMRNVPDLRAAYQARLDDIDAWHRTSADPEAVSKLERRLRDLLDDLDAKLADGRQWITGSEFSLADIWLTCLVARLKQFWIDRSGKRDDRRLPPRLAAYADRLRARPAFGIADIWENVRPGFMARMIAPFALPRVAAALVIGSAAIWGGAKLAGIT